jgi:hypothetical protein
MANYKSILFEQMIKEFAENEVKPLAQEVDELERFPAETVEKMAKLGTESREDMPQVDDISKVRNSEDIPTGYLEFVDPKKLKPIQDGIKESILNHIVENWDKEGKRPVLISKDNWIIDGHHRVKAAIKKNKWVRVIRIDLPGKKALTAVKKLVNNE